MGVYCVIMCMAARRAISAVLSVLMLTYLIIDFIFKGLVGKTVVCISAGSTYSAAITQVKITIYFYSLLIILGSSQIMNKWDNH